jgi:hypothetical protein
VVHNDALAGYDSRHACPKGLHVAHRFVAGDERVGRGGRWMPVTVQIAATDGGGPQADQYLARSR